MISFSERCIAALTKEIGSRRLKPIEFESVHGRHEAYEYARIVQKNSLVELYVYTDEAGCKLNRSDWTIFEKWDFSDENDLIRQFVDYVIKLLTTGPDRKDEHQGWLGSLVEPD